MSDTVTTSSDYTTGEVRWRILIYILIGILGSLLSGVVDLASMPDAQLNAMSELRWTLKVSLLALGAALAGANAFRAAIDRSTSAPGSSPAPSSTPQPTIPTDPLHNA